MLDRVANYLKKVVFPVTRVVGGIGVGFLVLLMLVTLIDVFGRRFLNAPLRGSRELSELIFCFVTFLPLAYCAIKDGHIELDILVNRFPKRLRNSIGTVIIFCTTAMLSVMTWQLVVYGMRMQRMNQETAILGITTYPFLYLAALGSLLFTLVYLVQFFVYLNQSLRRS